MTITEQTTIADIATNLPASVPVFQRHGVDFCCGGKTPLGIACEEHGVPFEALVQEIDAATSAPAAEPQDWTRAPLHQLIDHIVEHYHEPLRDELPRLETMASRIAQVHAGKGAHLPELEATIGELASDLLQHMQKEEMVLFPAIRAIESGRLAPVATSIQAMEQEHDRAGELLETLRRITGSFAVPQWGCQTVRALYHGLETLESSLHVHIHLENNVLFPRALQRTLVQADSHASAGAER